MRTLTNDTDFYVGVDGMVYSNLNNSWDFSQIHFPTVCL